MTSARAPRDDPPGSTHPAPLRAVLSSVDRATLYPVVGVLLALGAPGGLLLIRVVASPLSLFAATFATLSEDPVTFAYVGISTAIAFAVLGRLLGRNADRLRQTAITDPLTGLRNRRYFHERLQAELKRASRYHSPVSFLLVDVDELKHINDSRGHEAGDAAISAVATALVRTCRASDVAARFGGDEFAILAPGVRAEGALELADRIRHQLKHLPELGPGPRPTVSIGVTDADLAGARPEKLYSEADVALYEAKARGRDRAVISPKEAVAERPARNESTREPQDGGILVPTQDDPGSHRFL